MSSILIVDDEAPIREFLSRWLTAANHHTVEAPSADVALTMIGEAEPDVMLCDVHMPERDGIWLMEQVRGRYPRIAIVLATASDDVAPAISMRRGVVDYLVKPFERRSVLDAVNRAAEWRQREASTGPTPDATEALNTWLNGRQR